MPNLAMFLIALEIPHLAAAYSSPVQVGGCVCDRGKRDRWSGYRLCLLLTKRIGAVRIDHTNYVFQISISSRFAVVALNSKGNRPK